MMLSAAFAAVLAGALVVALSAAPAAATPSLGDAERGAKLWRRCSSCHAVGSDAVNKTGPHLNALFGRKAAAIEGFGYSKAMRRAGADGLVWDPKTLDVYIENPKNLVSRTSMKFGGLPAATDRRDLLAFLRQYSASPSDIPESAPTAAPTDPDVAPEILALKGDPDYGEYLSSECVTCHRADGTDTGIPSITGWRPEDFVRAMHAYKVKVRPHPVMQMMAGRLSDEEIAGLAAYFEKIGKQ